MPNKFTPVAIVPKKYPSVLEARNIAVEQGQSYGPSEEHDARGDALRHIVWQALTAKAVTPNFAKGLGDWHELPLPRWVGAAGVPFSGKELAQMRVENDMDQYNNALGREIAAKANSVEEILKLAKEAVDSGRAKYTPVDQLGEDASY